MSRDKNPLVIMRFPPPLPSPKPSSKPSPLPRSIPRSIPSPLPSSLHIETVSRPGSKYPFDTDTFDTDLIRRAFPNMTGRERRKFKTLVTSSDIPFKPEPRRSSQSEGAEKILIEEQDALRRSELEAIHKKLYELDESIAENIEHNKTIPYEATEATSTGLLSSIINGLRRTSKKSSTRARGKKSRKRRK